MAEYESFRPVFAGQQNTLDALKTLGLLQQSRSNQNFWYVLLADQQSYFSQPAGPISTNKPARTNLAPPAISFLTEGPASATSSTNISPAKPGFIAELCVPDAEEAARRRLSQLVSDLKQQRLFSKVDLLSDDLRRNLADPKVVIPERHFVLALDLAETELRQPLRLKSLTAPGSTRSSPKRGSRSPAPSSDTTDKLSQTQP